MVHGYHQAIGHVFLSDVSNTIFKAFVYSTIFRITRQLPLAVAILLVVILIVWGCVRSNRNSRPWR